MQISALKEMGHALVESMRASCTYTKKNKETSCNSCKWNGKGFKGERQ
jgi:hypothetical protein